jgi:site-specific DNA-methyltransferase (adenine-specific)
MTEEEWVRDHADKNSAGCFNVAIAALRERLEKSRVVVGDCTLYCEDCRFILPTLRGIDHVITDPPYGDEETHAQHLSSITLKNGEPARQALGFDGISADELVCFAKQWVQMAKRWVVFTCEWKHAHRLHEVGLLVRLGVWRKPDGAPQFTGDRPGTGWEAIAICHRPGRKSWNGGGRHAVWNVPKAGKFGHPTEKPEGLIGAFVRDFTSHGEVILDPFMGSGTTGAMAVKQGRKFIGIERERKYFDIACRRIEDAYKQPDMFVAPPEPKPEQMVLGE